MLGFFCAQKIISAQAEDVSLFQRTKQMKKPREKKNMGVVGYGDFAAFFLPHLRPYFNIAVFDANPTRREEASFAGFKPLETLAEVADYEFIFLAVPVQYLEDVLKEVGPMVKRGTVVLDVSSVKVRPVEMMMKYLGPEVDILGTHPLFGPQSGKNGIEGLNIVLCPVRSKWGLMMERFLDVELKLNVLVRTPERHDQQMAYVQALTHFVGRAVNEMDIPDVEQKTPAYQYLLNIKRNLGRDSLDLFMTIERENPYAKQVREDFMRELAALDEKIG